ncbi:hypothetical protein D3C80_1243290 [compost metagenome]
MAVALRIGGGARYAWASRLRARTRAKHRAAAEAQIAAVGIAQAVDAVVTDFADQGQAAGTPDLVEELGSSHLRLEHRHTLVGGHFLPWHESLVASADQIGRTADGGGDEVRRRQLQRHVRSIADFTTQRGTTYVGLEAQAIQADVFWIIDEVAGLTDRIGRRGASGWQAGVTSDHVDVRISAVIVHVVRAELGVVHLRHEPAQG